jgi:hypothetical protein
MTMKHSVRALLALALFLFAGKAAFAQAANPAASPRDLRRTAARMVCLH